MFIVNKDRNDGYNSEFITNIYTDTGNCTIKVSAGNTTRGGILGKYETIEAMMKAYEMLFATLSIKNDKVIYMPTDAEVEAKIRTKETHHHITGKKTKGHGGS